jgi:HPt (histidine-containing phosphotransfer) domain-containing protein
MRLPTGQVRLDNLLLACRIGEQIDHELLKEMLTLFISENGQRIATALAAAERGNHLELRGAVHALKGSAALIGADHLGDLADDLEFRVGSGTAHDPQRAALRLRDEYIAVVSTLRSIYPDLVAD